MKDAMRRMATGLAVVAATLLSTAGLAEAHGEEAVFVRVAESADGTPAALEVALASYRGPRGAVVDLISAVHVADRSYFQALNARLAGYPVVLYELVAEPGAVPTLREKSLSAIGLLQGGIRDALGLAFQLDEIDYSRANMVHADFTSDEFSADMRERGESLVGLMLRAWVLGLAQQGSDEAIAQQAEMIKVLFAEDPRLALKRALASQLAGQTDLLRQLSGPSGTALIEGRNARALERLREQLDAGVRRVAIFYGAGHMPDFDRRLVREFGMRRTATEWIEAWNLRGGE